MSNAAFVIIDVETSGLDPQADKLLEVGAVVYDAEEAAIISCWSDVVCAPNMPRSKIHRIPPQVSQRGRPREQVEMALRRVCSRAAHARPEVYLLAHNAEFDRQWIGDAVDGCGDWICTLNDSVWEEVHGETGSLSTVAAAYDVPVVGAHRAINDCLTLAAILTRVAQHEEGLEDWIERALEPKREVVGLQAFDDNQKAKDAGFRWVSEQKQWVRKVRESKLGEFCDGLGFKTKVVE